jgi:hypothetical protein
VASEESPESRKHKWLAWVGLQEPPPDPDAWVPVASGPVDNPTAGTSRIAARIAETLQRAGIDTQQRRYVAQASVAGYGGGGSGGGVGVAVLVHERDLERARTLSTEQWKSEFARKFEPISDEELTRLALQAPNPESTS